jgi:uncharacterized membrane protein YkvA (DUF1232 family)
VPLLVVLYFLSPVDFLPDIFLGLGQLDDLGVLILGLSLIARFAPRHVVDEHRQALGLDGAAAASEPWSVRQRSGSGEPTRPIDAEYRVIRNDSE